MNSPVTHNPQEDAFYEKVDPRKTVVLVEVIFTNNGKVTRHVKKGSPEIISKSPTTIGELFRRLD